MLPKAREGERPRMFRIASIVAGLLAASMLLAPQSAQAQRAGTVEIDGVSISVAASESETVRPGSSRAIRLNSSVAELVLQVPAGATSENTRVTTSLATADNVSDVLPAPEGGPLLLGLVLESPEPFLLPARATLNFPTDLDAETLALAWWDGSTWGYLRTTVEGGAEDAVVSAEVTEPGVYAVISDPAAAGLRLLDVLPRGTSTIQAPDQGLHYRRLQDWPFGQPPRALWVTSRGRWVGYSLGAPVFTQRGFIQLFGNTIPAGTLLIVLK